MRPECTAIIVHEKEFPCVTGLEDPVDFCEMVKWGRIAQSP